MRNPDPPVLAPDASVRPELAAARLALALDRIAHERNPSRLTRLVAFAGFSLRAVRDAGLDDWSAKVLPMVRGSKAFDRLQEDPFTNHAFLRPRGYPGDAALLDHIYRPDEGVTPNTSETGRAVFRFTSAGPAPRAVRNRQSLLARKVDQLAATASRPLRVASLACGHLREADLMGSLEAGLVEHFWAIDQDTRSVEEVARSFEGSPVHAVHGSARNLIRGELTNIDDLDFVYAAGLLDYLEDRTVQRLMLKMFERLRPGGTLWAANFMPHTPDRGYMEAVMDWWLVYRGAEQMSALGTEIDKRQICAKRVFFEGEGNIVFLELQKR